jgi:hypothetical protein
VLKERIEHIKPKKNDAFKSRSEFTEEMSEICKDFVIIHDEMIFSKPAAPSICRLPCHTMLVNLPHPDN